MESVLVAGAGSEKSLVAYPIFLEAILRAEEASLDLELETCRALQRSSVVRTVGSQALLLGGRLGHISGWSAIPAFSRCGLLGRAILWQLTVGACGDVEPSVDRVLLRLIGDHQKCSWTRKQRPSSIIAPLAASRGRWGFLSVHQNVQRRLSS